MLFLAFLKNEKVSRFFQDSMERHKRVDSWIVASILIMLFFYSLWFHNVIVTIISFVLVWILPFLFPKPKKKIKFISDVIDWEIAWCRIPSWSKLVSWTLEGIGFIILVYGTWLHNWLLILVGTIILTLGLIDFLIRFGYRRAIEGVKKL